MSLINRIIRVVATVVMFTLNILATALPLGGMTTWQLSDSLHTLITPAWWTFAIWSVIYLGLATIMILVAWWQINASRHIVRTYVISCLCNGAWIVAWQYGYLTASMLIIVWLLVSLIMLDQYVQRHEVEHFQTRVRSVVLVYFGWVQIATLLMTTIYLIYGFGWITADIVWWPLLVIALAWVANLAVIWRAGRIETSVVALWALAGIYYGQTNVDIRTACLITAGILLIGIAFQLRHYSVSKSLTTWV